MAQIISISLGWLELLFLILYCFALNKSTKVGKPISQEMHYEGGEREDKGKKKDQWWKRKVGKCPFFLLRSSFISQSTPLKADSNVTFSVKLDPLYEADNADKSCCWRCCNRCCGRGEDSDDEQERPQPDS